MNKKRILLAVFALFVILFYFHLILEESDERHEMEVRAQYLNFTVYDNLIHVEESLFREATSEYPWTDKVLLGHPLTGGYVDLSAVAWELYYYYEPQYKDFCRRIESLDCCTRLLARLQYQSDLQILLNDYMWAEPKYPRAYYSEALEYNKLYMMRLYRITHRFRVLIERSRRIDPNSDFKEFLREQKKTEV